MFSSAFDPKTSLPPGSLTSKVVLVTGGNTGLGLQSILAFARGGARVYLCSRSSEKATAAITTILASVPTAAVHALPLDLTSFPSIQACAAGFLARESTLHILLNNAGIMAAPAGTTPQGHELQLGTNVIGHHLLTRLLLGALRAAGPGRVVNVSSIGHLVAVRGIPGLDTGDVTERLLAANTWERYGVSKLGSILVARELARREMGRVEAVSVHPGVAVGGLYQYFEESGILGRVVVGVGKRVLWWGEEEVARNQICMATRKLEEGEDGGYFVPVGIRGDGAWWHPAGAGRWARDEALARRFWEWVEGEVEKCGGV